MRASYSKPKPKRRNTKNMPLIVTTNYDTFSTARELMLSLSLPLSSSSSIPIALHWLTSHATMVMIQLSLRPIDERASERESKTGRLWAGYRARARPRGRALICTHHWSASFTVQTAIVHLLDGKHDASSPSLNAAGLSCSSANRT